MNKQDTIRPEVSEKNKYWIEKHRYYELKHFCLQYPMWKKALTELDGYARKPVDEATIRSRKNANPTERAAMIKAFYSDRVKLIEEAAQRADSELASYILEGVTQRGNYDVLRAKLSVPCDKRTYYDRLRRFFWLLDEARG